MPWLISARLAQSVERWTLNPTVVGSSPTLGEFLQEFKVVFFSHLKFEAVSYNKDFCEQCFDVILNESRSINYAILVYTSITSDKWHIKFVVVSCRA